MKQKHPAIPGQMIAGERDADVFRTPTVAQWTFRKNENSAVAITLILSGLLRKRENNAWQHRGVDFWRLSATKSSQRQIE